MSRHSRNSVIALSREGTRVSCVGGGHGPHHGSSEPQGAASRGRLIPFGQLPGVPVDTRSLPKVRSIARRIHELPSGPARAMKIGVVFPQTEIGQDPAMIRDYAQAVESMGYAHMLAFDSVVGANPDRPGGWDSQFTYRHAFHEPFVLFGFCAGVTRRIELVTGIIILPQRQTALVAKQAAAVDVLSGGRLRLGIGVGWNTVEFDALGANFGN